MLVDSSGMDQVIEVVKRAIVYGKDKGKSGTNFVKNENQNKEMMTSMQGKPKGGKALWGPNKGSGPKGHMQIVMGEYILEVPSRIVMVVACGDTVQEKTDQNNENKGKGKLGSSGEKPPPNAFSTKVIIL